LNRLFNKIAMVGAALVALYLFVPPAKADILDVVRNAIYTKNLSDAIKRTDWQQAIEKATIKTIDAKTREYQYKKNIENWENSKNNRG
jgi:hypothetical protein